jgi:hypothetical protein
MARYFFHCIDGADLILDRGGSKAADHAQALGQALLVAERAMGELPDYEDWASWVVGVYNDEQRMIATVPFDRAMPASANVEAAKREEAILWTTCLPWPRHHPSTRRH